jgi:uncharacterized integral membrane protein (TIGR00697 family)
MLYVALGLCAELLVYKPISMGHSVASAGSFISPFWFILSDIIAELYGYKAAKNMFYCMLVVDFIVALILVLLIHFPSPLTWHGESDYEMIFGPLLKLFLATFVGFFIGGFLNIRLVTKWKVLLKGRYFWLRSIGASMIGEIIFTSLGFAIMLYGTTFQGELVSMIFWGIALKATINILLSFPANIVVFVLKKTDCTRVIASEEIANPFLQKA